MNQSAAFFFVNFKELYPNLMEQCVLGSLNCVISICIIFLKAHVISSPISRLSMARSVYVPVFNMLNPCGSDRHAEEQPDVCILKNL